MFFKWQLTRYGQLVTGIFYLVLYPVIFPILFVGFNFKTTIIEFKEGTQDWVGSCIKLIKGKH